MNIINKIHNKAFILHHLGIGDMIVMNGSVRYIAQFYDEVHVVSKDINLKNTRKIYADNPKIKIITIDERQFLYFNPNRQNAIQKLMNDNFDIYLSGAYKDGNRDELFFKIFYNHMNLDYSIKKQYQKINRNFSIEQALFDKVITNNNIKEYIFLHNNSSNITLNFLNDPYFDINHPNYHILVFNVGSNFYEKHPEHKYHNIWNNTYSDLIDYCMLIEKCTELHLIDSSFYTLSLLLDLSQIKVKVVYPRDYSASMSFYNEYDNNTFKVIFP